jgi:pyrroloquinoline quinone (PQQ) biosynthesis protein C
MISAEDIDEFVIALDCELRERRLSILDAEFLTAIEEGSISRAQIGKWARSFYRATRNGRLLIGNFYANSPDDPKLRRELAANIFEEETGGLSGVGKCHMDVFHDFLDGCGVAIDESDDSFSYAQPIALDDFWVELAAYGFSVEAPNAEFCRRVVVALKRFYGFTDDQLTWFIMHAALDAGHGAEFRAYAARAAEQPDGLGRVRAQTLALSEGVRDVWNGGGHWQA